MSKFIYSESNTVSMGVDHFLYSSDFGDIDVSSHGRKPYKLFSPFSHDKKFCIPVPGMENIRSDSVEGIWQGLKIISGVADFSLFSGLPKKRKGNIEGHLLNDEVLGYLDARKKIYVPAFVYHAVNNVVDEVKNDLEERLISGPVSFYDCESNGSISDLSKPYAHSALLVKLLNFLVNSPLPPFNKKNYTYLHEQLDDFLLYRNNLKGDDLALCDDVITFAYMFSKDDLKQLFALRAIESGKIADFGRLNNYVPSSKTKDVYNSLRR